MPPEVAVAHAALVAEGFVGQIVGVTSLGDERHALHLVRAGFHEVSANGQPELVEDVYIVVADLHVNGGAPRMLPLSSAVHLLQNVGSEERWTIELREP